MTNDNDCVTAAQKQAHPDKTQVRKSGETHRIRQKFIRRTILSILAFGLLLGSYGGLVAHQVTTVRGHLDDAVTRTTQLRSELAEEDFIGAQKTVALMQQDALAAREKSSGVLWKAASSIPVLGPNMSAVTEISVSVDDVVSRAVAPLVMEYGALNWEILASFNGQIDIAALQQLTPTVISAADAVRLSQDRLASIDESKLMDVVAEPIRSATVQLGEVDDLLRMASSAAQLLPQMLGNDGPRNYLLLIQNSAETRATGGIPGALAVLTAKDGSISLSEQTSAGALGAFSPSLSVDREQEALYTARLGTQMQNVNLTPDFSTAASTAKKMWELRNDRLRLDGVIALDPVVLSHLLDATGPIDVADPSVLSVADGTSLPTELSKDNVVTTLVSDVYREIDEPATQDAYFAAVASQIFTAFTARHVDGVKLFNALSSSVNDRRLYLWSDHEEEQRIISTTRLAGSISGPDAGGMTFGAYFNDGTGAKMDFYVKRSVQLIQSCPVDDYGRYTVRITATNTAPADAASSLPAYVTGDGVFGVAPGRVRTNYVVYGPSQAFVETASVNGHGVPLKSGNHSQRPVGTVSVELGPGEAATIDVVFSKVVQSSEPQLRVTPSIQPLEDVVLPFVRETCG